MFDANDESLIPRRRSRFTLERELAKMPWREFEQLSEAVVRRLNPQGDVRGVNRPGTRGADGVDFAATCDGNGIAYQVKSDASMSPARLRVWVQEFLNGCWRPKCDEFIILSAVRPSPILQRFFLDYRDEIQARDGVTLQLHDAGWFDEIFCANPDIAGRFFGDDAHLFYADRLMLARATTQAGDKRAQAFRKFELPEYGGARCTDVGFYMSAYLPDDTSDSLSALIMLWEPGLYGAMIALSNDQLLDAFEEAEWTDELPFYCSSASDGDFLDIGNARVQIPRSTSLGLADAIRFVRNAWHDRMRVRDGVREAAGYQYLHDLHGVRVGRIDARMWQALLEFANAHPHEEEGPMNVFYDHHAFLDIFTSREINGMRPGHHAMLQTCPIVELGKMSREPMVDVIWKMPPNILDDHNDFSRRAWWPVHMVARWFEEELLPATWSWHHRDQRTLWKKLTLVRHEIPEFKAADFWYTKRATQFEQQRPQTREALQELLEDLQQHYSLRDGTFSSDFLRVIDVSLLRLLECARLDHWGYVGSKGDFSASSRDGILAELQARIQGSYSPMNVNGIEWRLRTFNEICALSTGPINVSDIEAVASILAPLCRESDRHNERLAHRLRPPNVYPK